MRRKRNEKKTGLLAMLPRRFAKRQADSQTYAGKGEGRMKRQHGLKITAKGITPDWFRGVLPALEKQRSSRKQKSQQAAEQRGLITPEKVLEHFNTAEKNGTWSRLGNSNL